MSGSIKKNFDSTKYMDKTCNTRTKGEKICPKKILFECGTSCGSKTFTSPDDQPIELASVTVDISCFKKPNINIEFSSLVTFEGPLMPFTLMTTIAEVILDYTLVSCQDKSEIEIDTWTYKRSIPVINSTLGDEDQILLSTTDTFKFNKCICEKICPGCITYFVRVKPRVITQITNAVTMETLPNANATVFMGRMAAFAQEC